MVACPVAVPLTVPRLEDLVMRSVIIVSTILMLSGCGEATSPQRYTDCRSVAERVSLENISPGSILPASSVDASSDAMEEALIELETQRAGFMTVVHEQRMALGLTKVNRYAQRYLAAYGECRKIDAGVD